MTKLTKRQSEVLQLIQDQMETTGSPPTRAEIAHCMGFRSPNAAEDHLRALARKGMIELVPGTSRGIRLLQEIGLPIVGQVATGKPILSEQNIEATYRVDKHIFHPNADYLFKIYGNSMKDSGLEDGDLLAIHISSDVKDGQIVVARINNEVTVKLYSKEEEAKDPLDTERANFDPNGLNLVKQPMIIEGIAVGIIRKL
jgi:repressor LexA